MRRNHTRVCVKLNYKWGGELFVLFIDIKSNIENLVLGIYSHINDTSNQYTKSFLSYFIVLYFHQHLQRTYTHNISIN